MPEVSFDGPIAGNCCCNGVFARHGIAAGSGAEGPPQHQSYYQKLMPTIQQAGKLSVRERDKRFGPAITSAFDLATMTRLAVGPTWKWFSPAQQARPRKPLPVSSLRTMRLRSGLFGRSLCRRSADHAGVPRRRRDCQDQDCAVWRSRREHQLSGPRQTRHRCVSQWHDKRSGDPPRRICVDPCRRRCRWSGQTVAGTNANSSQPVNLQNSCAGTLTALGLPLRWRDCSFQLCRA